MFEDVTPLLCNTTPISKRIAAQCVRDVYSFCKTPGPQIIFVDGPIALKEQFDPTDEGLSLFDHNDISHFISRRGYSTSMRLDSVITQIFSPFRLKKKPGGYLGSTVFSMPEDHIYKGKYKYDAVMTPMWDNCYVLITLKNKCFVVERPWSVKTNDRGFHCTDGPAIVFRDGTEIYCYEGLKVDEKVIMHPDKLTLNDIHKHNSRKHFLIDRCGVDRYLDLVKAWKPPETKNRFQKFFGFHEMIGPPGDETKEKWNRKGHAWMHEDKPYTVNFERGSVNGKYGDIWKHDSFNEFHHFAQHPFVANAGKKLFNKCDRELWDLFDIKEMQHRGPLKFQIGFQKDKFWLKTIDSYEKFPSCRHDCVPSWFKAKMFRKQDALYETDRYAVKYENGELSYAGEVKYNSSGCTGPDEDKLPYITLKGSLFGGCENVPHYNFRFEFEADTWEGFLEKWAIKAFNWLGLHEDSCRMP